jgi:hypothetical protein
MSTLLFYKDITILNRDKHRNYHLKSAGDFEFAAETHFVPLAGQEFFRAARDYPILFIGGEEQTLPIALLGLAPGQNSYLDENKVWVRGVYVPAFVRRYPFVLAEMGNENSSVCFDAAFAGWNESEGKALFNEEGENSEFLSEILQFLQNYAFEMKRTQAFVARLKELDLLQPKTLKLSHSDGNTFTVRDFMAVDEEAFGKLSDEQVLSLHKDGFLGWIYAHLMSLGSVNGLFDRYLAGQQKETTASEEVTTH